MTIMTIMTKNEALDTALGALRVQEFNTGYDIYTQAIAVLKALAQPEQKPVGKLMPCKEGWFADIDNPPPLGAHEGLLLYTSPNAVEPQQKRKWVGLTHEKARELVGSYGNDPYNLAYKTEAALREKNHD